MTPPQRGLDVLVVEDDPDNAELLPARLRSRGCRVTHAISAEAALPLCADYDFDLLIVDLCLPGKSGGALIMTLRAETRWAQVPMVVSSILDETAELSPQVTRTLTKPYRMADLDTVLVYVTSR